MSLHGDGGTMRRHLLGRRNGTIARIGRGAGKAEPATSPWPPFFGASDFLGLVATVVAIYSTRGDQLQLAEVRIDKQHYRSASFSMERSEPRVRHRRGSGRA
jgi:hypothetical protein